MAEPIQKILRDNPVADPVESGKPTAMEELQMLVEQLHDSGILETLRAMLGAKEAIAKIAVNQLRREEVITLLNNVMASGTILTKIDSSQLERLTQALGAGLAEAEQTVRANKKLSMFDLVKTLKDPDVNRSLQFGIGFLKGLGKNL